MSFQRPSDGLKPRFLNFDGAIVATRRLDDLTNGDDLSMGERALVSAAHSESRRRELRAGRAAAHEALRAAGSSSPQEVLKKADQRPSIAGFDEWHVSLAHDGGLAVAACDVRPVGVDVAPFRRRAQVERVVRSAIGARVARPLEGDQRWPASLLLWTAWEALGKQRGVGVLGEAMQAEIHLRMVGNNAVALVGKNHLRWWIEEDNLFCLATTRPALG